MKCASQFLSLFPWFKQPKKESQKTTIDGISHLQIHLLFQIGELSELRGNRIHQFNFRTVPQNAANLAVSVKLNPQVLKSTA